MSRRASGDIPGQFHIDWSASAEASKSISASPLPLAGNLSTPILRLRWDFKNTFPPPTPEAIDAGRILDEDTTPEAVRSIHDEHAREALATLQSLDALLDARRRGVDPVTGKIPRTPAGCERLAQRFQHEPERLEHAFTVLMEVYEDAFGTEAREAFAKAIRAWHADIEVTADLTVKAVAIATETKPSDLFSPSPSRRERPRRIPARLPVPRPLASAITAEHFGQDENGKPIRPGAHEVRAITEQHAEKLIGMLDTLASAPVSDRPALLESFQNGLTAYAEDFGQPATDQLEAYVRRQAELDSGSRRGR